jgi:hypothetical protein
MRGAPRSARQRRRSRLRWSCPAGSGQCGRSLPAVGAAGFDVVFGGCAAGGWPLAVPVGLAVQDEFPGGGLEPVEGGLGEQSVGHQGQPFNRDWLRFRMMVLAFDLLVSVSGVSS